MAAPTPHSYLIPPSWTVEPAENCVRDRDGGISRTSQAADPGGTHLVGLTAGCLLFALPV